MGSTQLLAAGVGPVSARDFFAPSALLVVEVDGAQHSRQRGADQRRDGALAAAGLCVLRLPASLVRRQLDAAVRLVAQVLQA